MSDVSSFIRRGHSNSETINKLQAIITPLAFADPEADSLKERIILSSPRRLRTITASTGLDITDSSTATRKRTSTSLTIVPDTSSPSTFPVSPSTVGTLDFDIAKKYGAGARFDGTQYITIPDNNQFDLSLPYFTMAFWFKSTNGGTQTIYNKSNFNFDQDYCSVCTDFSDDFQQVSTPVLTVYYDKVSAGTIDHSSVTGDLSNSEDAILGAENTSLDNPLNGTLALFEYQETNWTTDDIDSYHDDARIRVTGQKAAFHFTGNDSSESTLETIAF